MNYALGKVRQLVFDMAEELVTGYDLDVLELDFIRFAFYFPRAEAYAQRHVLTGLVRRIRELCREQRAEDSGRGAPRVCRGCDRSEAVELFLPFPLSQPEGSDPYLSGVFQRACGALDTRPEGTDVCCRQGHGPRYTRRFSSLSSRYGQLSTQRPPHVLGIPNT